jgi:hypothetical protein
MKRRNKKSRGQTRVQGVNSHVAGLETTAQSNTELRAVHWHSPIFGQSGYDFAARFLIAGLIDRGIDIAVSTDFTEEMVRICE